MFSFALTLGNLSKKILTTLWDDYRQEHENKNYIIRNKYTYARLRFYEFQSGIFAYIDPRCRSPPPSFQIRTKPKFERMVQP